MRMAAVDPTVSSSRSQRATVLLVTPTRTANPRCVNPNSRRTRLTSLPVIAPLYVRHTLLVKQGADLDSLLAATAEVTVEVRRANHAIPAKLVGGYPSAAGQAPEG